MAIIRKMEARDIPEVYRLGTNEPRFRIGSGDAKFWTIAQLERWVASDDVLLVAETNGKVIGYALSQYHSPTRKATFENLHVAEGQRGIGLAHGRTAYSLASKMLVALEAKGAEYICGTVEPDNKVNIKLLEYIGLRKGKQVIWMDKTV